ncbi:MAG: FG-GAP-like repeat-containing protein, partial [Planctomycetota bacterium]
MSYSPISFCLLAPVLGLLGFDCSIVAQELKVDSISPTQNSIGASPAASIRITFDANLDLSSVNPSSVQVFGRWSGVVNGLRTVTGNTLTFTPTRSYFPSETVTVTLSSELASGSGDGLTKGYTSSFWVAAMPGSGNFTFSDTIEFRLSGEGEIRTYGFSACDFNRDGSPDISGTNAIAGDIRSLVNDGCGNFTSMKIHPMPAGERPSPNHSADFNADGWPDLVTGNQIGSSVAIFLNDGAGSYTSPVLYSTAGETHGVTILDANADGHMDVAATDFSNLVLFLNDGNGVLTQFGSVFDSGGDGEWEVLAGDANNDGISDLFVSAQNSGEIALLLGDGAGSFSASDSEVVGGDPRGLALGDVNNDGNLDIVATRYTASSAAVLLGDGNGNLATPVTYATGGKPISIDLGDLEGDGDLDMTVSNFDGASVTVYENNGSGVFVTPLTLPAEIAGACTVLMDHDRDGDTDIMIIDERADKCFIWEQDGPSAPAVQQASCEAALRINGYAGASGFGSQPAVPAP